MTETLEPMITDSGLAAVFSAQNDGLDVKITQIALGDHGRTVNKFETELVQEKMRVFIADGERITANQIHLTAVASGGVEFWVREVGFYLEDGTLFAVWSSDEPLAYKSVGVDLLLAFDLGLQTLPADAVSFEGTQMNLSLSAWGEYFVSTVTMGLKNGAGVIKNAHWNLQNSEKIRVMGS